VNPAYLPIIAERLAQAHARCGRQDAAIDLLKAYLERRPSPDLLHFLFQTVTQARGWDAARKLAAEELKRHPSLRALDDYLQASNALQPSDQADQGVENRLAQDLVHRQVSRNAHYLCGNCGFKARQYFWQCPACARWESISPEREEHD
jgi:lipopolysaccharide biosynthesis regulator YciM